MNIKKRSLISPGQVAGYFELKTSKNSHAYIRSNGYDAARCMPIPNSNEFPTFIPGNRLTLSVFVSMFDKDSKKEPRITK